MTNGTIIFIVIIIILFIICVAGYFLMSNDLFNINTSNNNMNNNMSNTMNNMNNNMNNKNNYGFYNTPFNSNKYNNSNECVANSDKEQVYHLSDNIFTYDDAQAACSAYDGRLANLDEMIEAYKNGADWCSYGWSDGQLALYPTQTDSWQELQDGTRKNQCGKPGVNGGFFNNKEFQFGANCYGKKPPVKTSEIEKIPMFANKLDPLTSKTSEYKSMINSGNIRVAPFSNGDEWYN